MADTEEDIGYAPSVCYGDSSSFGFFKDWDWFLRPTRLTLDPDIPTAMSTCTYIYTL
jgi:hypothetical protein